MCNDSFQAKIHELKVFKLKHSVLPTCRIKNEDAENLHIVIFLICIS